MSHIGRPIPPKRRDFYFANVTLLNFAYCTPPCVAAFQVRIFHNLRTFLVTFDAFQGNCCYDNQKNVFSESGTQTESGAPTSTTFSVSRTVFQLFAIFVYNGIFLSSGQFYPILSSALAPKIMNSYRENHKKARALMGSRACGAKNLLSRGL